MPPAPPTPADRTIAPPGPVRRGPRLSHDDARWVLAAHVARTLEGGRAAVLAPETRQQLTRVAARLGLRPFDASLVIAIVQDGARRGRPLDEHTASRLALVPRAHADAPAATFWLALAGSVGLAAVVAVLVAQWITAAA